MDASCSMLYIYYIIIVNEHINKILEYAKNVWYLCWHSLKSLIYSSIVM